MGLFVSYAFILMNRLIMNMYVFIHFNLIGSVRAIQQAVDNIIVMKISFTILILQYNFQTHDIFTPIIIDIW